MHLGNAQGDERVAGSQHARDVLDRLGSPPRSICRPSREGTSSTSISSAGRSAVSTTERTAAPRSNSRPSTINNKTLSGSPVLERCEGNIGHNWEAGSPGGEVSSDNFSARWTYNHNFEAGNYTLTADVNDGIRV